MRAVVAIKSTGGSGASRATRYISERDRDPEREDSLTYRGADRFLTRGEGTPAKEDLIHVAVSFHNEDYEQLGPTDAECKERLIEVVREGVAGMRDDLHAKELRWVAGIHLNTDHPHVHILISKEVVDREKGQPRRLDRIPKHLLAHRETGADGIARPVEGRIGSHFVTALDRQIERAREVKGRGNQTERVQGESQGLREWFRKEIQARAAGDTWNAPERIEDKFQDHRDRLILGDALEKGLRLEFASISYERAKSHGETFRFSARDESIKSERKISDADVQRRAEARGARIASEQNPRTSESRRALQPEAAGRDVERHQPTLATLHTKLVKLEKKLQGELSDARREYRSASELAQSVEQRYREGGKALPSPLITRDTINKLQEQAVSLTLPDRVESLERLRESLAVEHGQGFLAGRGKPDGEGPRGGAHAFISQSRLLSRSWTLRRALNEGDQ